jgi:hypothetical protein
VGLRVREDFAEVVDRSLYFVDVPGPLPLHYQDSAHDLGGGHDIQEESLTGLQQNQDQVLGEEHCEVVKHPLRLIHPAEGIRLF